LAFNLSATESSNVVVDAETWHDAVAFARTHSATRAGTSLKSCKIGTFPEIFPTTANPQSKSIHGRICLRLAHTQEMQTPEGKD
jgi:hypothetical protein